MTAMEPNSGRMELMNGRIAPSDSTRETEGHIHLEQEPGNNSSQHPTYQESTIPRPSVAPEQREDLHGTHHADDRHNIEAPGAAAEPVDERVVNQHYLTRTLSQQLRRGGQPHLGGDHDDEGDEARRGEKIFPVHPNCLCQLTLFYIEDDELSQIRRQGDEENNQGMDMQGLVPPLLQHIGVNWEEYQSTMELFQLRLLAWKGRRIFATLVGMLVGGLTFVFVFFSASGYALIFSLFAIFLSLWITDFWLNAEMTVLHHDARLIFAIWKPFVIAVFVRESEWGGIAPKYVLKFKPSRHYNLNIGQEGGHVNYIATHQQRYSTRRQREAASVAAILAPPLP